MLASKAAAYVWEDPGDSITIHLSLDVVGRLAAAAQEGLSPGIRSPEVGGVLIGRTGAGGTRTVFIDDFELVPCEHLRGASYTLSPKERQRLGIRLARRPVGQVVGYFRTHTRPGLYLDQDDLGTINGYFSDQNQVFLILRPSADGPPVGGFFFWEDGDINRRATYRQFPLDRDRLSAGDFPVTREPVPVAPPVPRRGPIPVPAPAPATRGSVLRKFPQVPWMVVPLIAGLFLMAAYFQSQKRDPKPEASAQDRARSVGPLLSLNVQKRGTGLQINWDPASPAVRNADLGILWITDGSQKVRRDLSPKELSSGTLDYTPSSPDVNFQLQVFTLTEQATTGAVRPPESPLPPATQVSLATPPVEISPAAQPIPVAQPPNQADRTENLASNPLKPPATTPPGVIPVGTTVDRTRLRHANRVASPTAPIPASKTATAVKTPARELEAPPVLTGSSQPLSPWVSLHPTNVPAPAVASVTYEEARSGPIRRVFRKLSNIGDEPGDYVPASPTHKVSPAVAATGDETSRVVDVKVFIDESGKVVRTQLLGRHNELAEPALDAARQWRFKPARKHEKPVSSEIVLHFKY
ncbi:MAG: energy transducer TonB [Bryobacteraceae bacterium]